jgi:hypothetical protein
MSKKKEHMAEPSKISVFRSFEEMKSSPVSFPSDKPLIELQAEYKDSLLDLDLPLPLKKTDVRSQ